MPLLQAKVMILEMAVPLKEEDHWVNIGLWHHLEEEEAILQHPLLVLLQIPIHSIGIHEDGGAGRLTVSIVTFCKGVCSRISSSSLSLMTSSCASPLHNKMVMEMKMLSLSLAQGKKVSTSFPLQTKAVIKSVKPKSCEPSFSIWNPMRMEPLSSLKHPDRIALACCELFNVRTFNRKLYQPSAMPNSQSKIPTQTQNNNAETQTTGLTKLGWPGRSPLP